MWQAIILLLATLSIIVLLFYPYKFKSGNIKQGQIRQKNNQTYYMQPKLQDPWNKSFIPILVDRGRMKDIANPTDKDRGSKRERQIVTTRHR